MDMHMPAHEAPPLSRHTRVIETTSMVLAIIAFVLLLLWASAAAA